MTPEDDVLIARKPRLSIDDDPSGVVTDWMIEATDRIKALAAEIDVLRRVVRAADEVRMSHAGYNRSVDDAGNDDMRAIRYKYDEARAALTEFDRAAQEKTNAGV